MPTAFRLAHVHTGRMVVNEKGYSIYTSDADAPDKSNCASECQKKWLPIRAGRVSGSHGGWSVIERSPGVLQWAFRKRPVYTYIVDDSPKSFRGSDEPGWHNVYLQKAPPWPKEFVEHNTHAGTVLADSKAKPFTSIIAGTTPSISRRVIIPPPRKSIGSPFVVLGIRALPRTGPRWRLPGTRNRRAAAGLQLI